MIRIKMSVKLKDDKPTTSTIVGCCQSTTTTPDNSVVDYIEEDLEASNNNVLFHAIDETSELSNEKSVEIVATRKAYLEFTFPKRPKVDIEFQQIKYTVKKFNFKNRHFGKQIFVIIIYYYLVILIFFKDYCSE